MRIKGSAGTLAGLLGLVACTGTLAPADRTGVAGGGGAGAAGGASPAAGSGGEPGATGTPFEPVAPDELEALCKADKPHPRRVLRLSTSELTASLRAIVALDAATLATAGFNAPAPGLKPDDTLSVSRDFHDNLNTLATGVAQAVAANPGSALGCAPTEFGTQAACTRDFLTKMAARFFRGQAATEDITALEALAGTIAKRSGGPTALEYAVRAMVLAPKSLYLTEGLDRAPGSDASKAAPMSPAELAAFLSFRIAGRPPSETLLASLRAAPNPTPAQLQSILRAEFNAAERQRARADFVAAWLNVADITRLPKDEQKNPQATPAFMARLQTESYDALMTLNQDEGLTLASLLTSPQRSAALDTDAALLAKVGRPGVFALPGVIAGTSANNHTDVPRRGRFLLKSLFCESLASPPAGAVTQTPPLPAGASERARFTAVEMKAGCSGCHQRIDHLAFAFESYDEVGRARTQDDHGNPIQTDSVHTVPGQPDIAFKDASELMSHAASSPVVQNCFAIQGFRYFARRGERGADDACALRDIARSARGTGFNLGGLVEDTLIKTALAPRGP